MERFEAEEIQSRMESIEGLFDEFGNTLRDINILVESLVQNGDNSAIYGYVGSDLFTIWDNNAATFDEFKKNFQHWAEVVQVISANNMQFAVDAAAIYRDTGKTLSGVTEARKAYGTGSKSIEDLTSGTNYNGFVGSTSEILPTEGPVDVLDESSQSNTNTNVSSTTISRGSVISLENGTYSYYGTTKKGTNLYTDASGDLYYSDENGNAINVTRSQYVGGNTLKTVNFNVNDIGKTYNGDPNSQIALNVNGEFIGAGNSIQSNISSTVVYEDSAMAPTVVSTLTSGDITGTTYRVGATNMNVSGSTDNIVLPDTSSEFMDAIDGHKDIKLPTNATLKYDPSGIWNTETLTNGKEYVYLRYDEGTQMYYIADENGAYSTSSKAYDPNVFTNGDSSIKFN